VAPRADGILVNANGTPTLSLLALATPGSRTLPLPIPRRPVTPAWLAKAREEAVASAGDLPGELLGQMRKALQEIPGAAQLPAIDALFFDGRFAWVREGHPETRGDAMQRWHRMDLRTAASSTLDLPVAWRVMGFVPGRVVVMEESEDGEGIIKGWPVHC
jgi:hypothetical protein